MASWTSFRACGIRVANAVGCVWLEFLIPAPVSRIAMFPQPVSSTTSGDGQAHPSAHLITRH
jgi:hypothetical protein